MERRRVKFIEKEKDRCSTYTTRKKGLINKAHDLSVLCGVDACMFITNAPSNSNKDQVDLVWSNSNNRAVVGELINKHKELSGKVYNVSDYYVDRKRKAEKELSSLKKRNCCDFKKLPTWNSKFDSMDEVELRDMANNLDNKLNMLKIRREEMMKIKRSESLINDSLCPCPSPQSNDDCDLQSSSMVEPNADAIVTNTISMVEPIAEAIVTNEKESAMNTIEDDTLTDLQAEFLYDDCDFLSVEPNAEAIVTNEKEMAMNTIEGDTLTDLQAEFLYDPSNPFVNYDSGAQTEVADVFSSFPAMISTDLSEYDFSLFDCSSMQDEAYACGNSQLEGHSFYYPPLSPLLFN